MTAMVSDDEVRRERHPAKRKVGAAVAALVVLGLAATATARLLTAGSPHRPSAPSDSGASVAPFRIHRPPTATPLIWLSAPSDQVPTAVRLRAADWQGREVGAEAFECLAPCSFDASPDGQRIIVYQQPADNQPPADAGVFDSDGRRLGAVADPLWAWADDGRHLCTLHGATVKARPAASGVARLDLVEPMVASRNVIADLAPSSAATSAHGDWQILACSTLADRVIATVQDQAGLRALRVIELSTGRTLYAEDLRSASGCTCAVKDLEVNHDGSVAVEVLASGDARLLDLSTGAVKPLTTSAQASVSVSCCSWNGHRMVAAVGRGVAGIVEIPSGTVRWRAAANAAVAIIAVRPRTDELALIVSSPHANNKVVIVDSTGSETDMSPALPAL